MRIERIGPVIEPGEYTGDNICGPSVLEVPDWVESPLGRYYLYFAHHKGGHIRLAYADDPAGPFEVHPPGVLPLADSGFPTTPVDPGPSAHDRGVDAEVPHVASPEVVLGGVAGQIRMYFHGLEADGHQVTRVAVSSDGIHFDVRPEVIVPLSYLRVFRYRGLWHGMAMPGIFFSSDDGLTGFRRGPTLFEPTMRHAALRLRGDQLDVLWTRVGDAPESILHSVVSLAESPDRWSVTGEPQVLLGPDSVFEGSDRPLGPSRRGPAVGRVRQLRDPALLNTRGDWYLYYAMAGESGVAVARLLD
ncbi:MAG: hypothetical protein ACYCS2_06140 [Acidimicrobiales bacterium]